MIAARPVVNNATLIALLGKMETNTLYRVMKTPRYLVSKRVEGA